MYVYAINFIPMYCPNCGNKMNIHNNTMLDFFEHTSMSCKNCNTHFVQLPATKIISAADDLGSDLSHYAEVNIE